tara:strand:+ start:265 stop:819 length:555 start_codon:yes stop_codon:yes gene_type:complete
MNIHEAIRNRRTIHSFTTDKVLPNIINRAIDAANQAPCHRLTFPWRFTNINSEDRSLLIQLAIKMKFGTFSQEHEDINAKRLITKMTNPSHLIVASQICSKDPKQTLEDYAACACAIQNLCLSLIADGVGSKWSTAKFTSSKETYQITKIDPRNEKVIGFLWIGYGEPSKKINRPNISSVFREN